MINWIISSSILIILVLLLRFILKRKISLRIRYAIWLLVAVRLLVPLNLGDSILSIENFTNQLANYEMEAAESQNVVTSPTAEDEYRVKIYDNVAHKDSTDDQNSLTIADEGINVYRILEILWIAGMIGVGAAFVLSNLIFTVKVRSSRSKIAITGCDLPVYISEKATVPCLFHVFHPTIYITDDVAENEKLLLHTITHEMTHYHHGDLLWNIVRCICLTVHWYNPLVWLAAILSKGDCELACDEAVIKKLGEPERLEYGKTLISLTCRKPAELFVVSTTMTSGKKSLKGRIRLIARKPRTTFAGCALLVIILVFAAGCTFTGAVSEDTAANENAEGAGDEEAMSDEAEQSGNISQKESGLEEKYENSSEQAAARINFYNEAEEDKVCLAVMPDGISKAGGDYRYIIPEDQVKWTDYYKQARSFVSGAGRWLDDERSMGIWIVFNDEWTCMTDQGFIYNFSGHIRKTDAEGFYELCMEEAGKYGTGTPVNPENFPEIASATLEYNGTYTVTDANILKDLRKIIFTSKELRGGTACPFTAKLTLELKEGGTEHIYLATDSCAAWLTDGVYYEYAGYEGIEKIYQLFAEYHQSDKNAENIIAIANARLRDGYVDAKLTYADNREVGWDFYADDPWESEEERDELAQAALKELYTLTGYQVEECVYTTDGRSRFIFGKSATYIGKSIAFYSRDYGFTLCGDSTPYMGFTNARRARFSDVQQLDSPYGKAEFSGHAAIPAWFLEHSGIYQGETITNYDVFNLDDTVYTHIKLFFDGGYYVVALDEKIESFHEAMGPYYE